MRNCKIYTLSNGIRVVHQYDTSTEMVHCGILLEIGSRDETQKNQGIAHFWEHMAFKGTKKRRAFHVNNLLESIGGELNAYTEKEKVVFYASVRKNYVERAVDVISDITFNSVFPEKEIEKERGVILEEMAMYLDDPDDSIQDEFESVIFEDHPMGMNILGTTNTVSSFRRRDFTSFIRKHIDTRRIVFSCVGNVSEDKLETLVKGYFEKIPLRKSRIRRRKFAGYRPKEVLLHRPVTQAKCAIGRDAFPIKHKNRIPFFMLVHLLGGSGMNSRLNLTLREKHGYVYSVDANYTPFSDTGLFAIYFGTEKHQLKKCMALIQKEMARLADKQLGTRQLSGLKEQIKGQLAMGEESKLGMMLAFGRSVLDFGKVPPLAEIYERVDQVDASILRDLAGKMFNTKKMSYLIMEPNGLLVNGSNQ